MAYNFETPSSTDFVKSFKRLRSSMSGSLVSTKILSSNDDVVRVEIITTLKPSLRMLNAVNKIMKGFNVTIEKIEDGKTTLIVVYQSFMLRQVKYKDKVVNPNDLEVTWTDCVGEVHIGSIKDYVSDYASEQVGIEMAGEAW